MKTKQSALERLVALLEAAQFNNGSLDITLQGPESAWTGSPLKMILSLQGEEIQRLSAELSSVAMALQNIADAIREARK